MKRPHLGVLATALLLASLSTGASASSGLVSSASVLDGTLRIAVACDLAGDAAAFSYELLGDGGETYLLSIRSEMAVGMKTGDRLRLTGRLRAGRFEVDDVLPLMRRSALAEREAMSSWTTGTRRVLAILIKFPQDATTPYTQAQAQSVLLTGTSSVKNLYAEMSYGQTTLVGDVTPWLTATVTKPTTCDTGTAQSQATARAQAAGYDLSNYDFLIYAHTALPGCGWAGMAYVGGSGAWINGGNFGTLVVGHELGHNFGLLHSHSLACSGSTFTPTCETAGSRSEYGDRFDTMGNSRSGHFNASQKSDLDWMPPSSVATHASGSSDYDLSTFEGTTGLRAVQIPTGVSGRTFWVEWRQPIGFDAGFPASGTGGAQIRIGPSRVGGTDLLDANPGTGSFDDAALPVGKTFGDSAADVSVTTLSTSGGALKVHVQFGIAVPTADFTFTPAAPVAGHAVTFTDASTGFVMSWSWSFGDGGTSTQQNPSYAFALPGTYSVSFTASNLSGSSPSVPKPVTVSPQPPQEFHTLTPCRVADTRSPAGTYGGPALGAGVSRTFPMPGPCGIPATARSVSLNLTVTGPTAAGYLSLFPAGTPRPLASTINFSSGQTRANNAVMELGTAGALTVYSGISSGSVHVILDVNGYFQ